MTDRLIKLDDLRGGMNDSDEPQILPQDQVAYAENIDWMQGTLGGKRAGCEAVTIDGSLLNRTQPTHIHTTTGGGTATSSVNINVPAIPDDGTGNTYVLMLVYISTKNAAENITNVTYQGNAITAVSESAGTGSSGRLELWQIGSPSLAGGTVAITAAAACDISAAVSVFGKTTGATGILTGTGTSVQPRINFPGSSAAGDTNGLHLLVNGFSMNTGAVATAGFLHTSHANTSNGQARLGVESRIGMIPTTPTYWDLNASVDWVMTAYSIQGAPVSAFPTLVTPQTLLRHTPTNNVTEDELWVVDTYGRIDRRVGGTWQLGVPAINQAVGIFALNGLDINGASLHGKFFIASPQVIDALLVWDGTVLRWAGFPFTPFSVTATNTAAGGTYSGTRYFRMRFVEQDGSGNVLRRSEAGPAINFVPSGVNTGAIITKPLVFGISSEDFISGFSNGQTHWEVEASLDNVNFYRIATVAVATGTYTDTTAFSTGYSSNPLSESVGENTPLYCARHVAVDDDRLVLGGHRQIDALDSRVSWTPVESALGVGNDERIPTSTKNFLDLDGLSGGGLQMLITGESGNIYAFKWERLYKLVRTGIVTSAYAPQTESHTRGCTKRAATSGQDHNGYPCVYFTDPNVGLCRVGRQGVESLGDDIQATWSDVTLSHPSLQFGPRMFYWHEKRQIWIRAKVNNVAQILVFNCRYGRDSARGWSHYKSTFLEKFTSGEGVMFPDGTTILRPFQASVVDPVIVKFTTDDVNDAGTRYRGYWVTKAYMPGNLFQKFGVMAVNIFARASSSTLGVSLLRNLGIARRNTTVSLAPAGTETHVFRPIDNAFMSECFVVQFEVGDPSSYTGAQLDQTWSINQLAAKWRAEDEATS